MGRSEAEQQICQKSVGPGFYGGNNFERVEEQISFFSVAVFCMKQNEGRCCCY